MNLNKLILLEMESQNFKNLNEWKEKHTEKVEPPQKGKWPIQHLDKWCNDAEQLNEFLWINLGGMSAGHLTSDAVKYRNDKNSSVQNLYMTNSTRQ
jgi:hypothetical protein